MARAWENVPTKTLIQPMTAQFDHITTLTSAFVLLHTARDETGYRLKMRPHISMIFSMTGTEAQ